MARLDRNGELRSARQRGCACTACRAERVALLMGWRAEVARRYVEPETIFEPGTIR